MFAIFVILNLCVMNFIYTKGEIYNVCKSDKTKSAYCKQIIKDYEEIK